MIYITEFGANSDYNVLIPTTISHSLGRASWRAKGSDSGPHLKAPY